MESSKVDTTAQLPYRVPVDKIIRFFQMVILAAGLGVLYTCSQVPKEAALLNGAIGIFFLAYGLYLQFRSSGLTVDENGISHVSIYFKKRSILWNDIERVVSGTQDFRLEGVPLKGGLGNVNPSMGPYLMIFTRKNGGEPFLLNFKPYSVRGLATLVSFLTIKSGGAKIDEKTIKMMQGIFPSVFFGEQKGHG